jgi:hypothetical protein
MAGAARGIAGAACAMGAGAPPRAPPPRGGSATAAMVETNRAKDAAIAARCRCRDMTRTPHNVSIQMRECSRSFRLFDANNRRAANARKPDSLLSLTGTSSTRFPRRKLRE